LLGSASEKLLDRLPAEPDPDRLVAREDLRVGDLVRLGYLWRKKQGVSLLSGIRWVIVGLVVSLDPQHVGPPNRNGDQSVYFQVRLLDLTEKPEVQDLRLFGGDPNQQIELLSRP